MKLAAVGPLHDARPDFDPAAEMDRSLGDISGVEIFSSQILVGVFLRGDKTASGLINPTMIREDSVQGKVTRILKIGTLAFSEADAEKYNGRLPRVGDWVFNRAQDSYQLSIRGDGAQSSEVLTHYPELRGAWPCRLVYARDIYGRITDPNMVV